MIPAERPTRRETMTIKRTFILREIAGDYVIVPVGATALDFNGIITVNETGAFLWGLLADGDFTEDELAEKLFQEFDTDMETAKRDVAEFVDSLKSHNII